MFFRVALGKELETGGAFNRNDGIRCGVPSTFFTVTSGAATGKVEVDIVIGHEP